MKVKRYTNKHGRTQIKRGKTYKQMRRLARRLRIPYGRPMLRQDDNG